MKSINVLYQEVKSDEELRSKFLAAYGKGEVEGFLKENECDATAEEVQKFIEQELRSGSYELSDEELALVVGGIKYESPGQAAKAIPQPKYHLEDHVRLNSNPTRILVGTVKYVLWINDNWQYKIRSSSENSDGEGIEALVYEDWIIGKVGP